MSAILHLTHQDALMVIKPEKSGELKGIGDGFKMVLSIPLYPRQRGPPPSTLSSRPERSAVCVDRRDGTRMEFAHATFFVPPKVKLHVRPLSS